MPKNFSKAGSCFFSRGALLVALALGTAAHAQTRVTIAVLGPTSGGLAEVGSDMLRATETAVKLRLKELAALGLDVQVKSFDDAANPAQGARLAEAILGDPSILGVVGALNSGVTLKAGEVLARGPVAIVSPSSTADTLTTLGWSHFLRVVAPDSAQSTAAADYIAQTVKPKAVFLVSDNTTYGNSLAKQLQAKLGDRRVRVLELAGATTPNDYRRLARRIGARGADMVFFGGTADKAAPFLKMLRAENVKAPFMGGDSLDSEVLAKVAQGDAAGALFVTVLGPLTAFTNRAAFARAYQEDHKRAAGGMAIYSFDAANALITGLATAAKNAGGAPSRTQVLDATRQVTFGTTQAVTGLLSFMPSGERASAPLFVMRLDDQTLTAKLQKVHRFVAPR